MRDPMDIIKDLADTWSREDLEAPERLMKVLELVDEYKVYAANKRPLEEDSLDEY